MSRPRREILAARLFFLPLSYFLSLLGYRLVIGCRGESEGVGVAIQVFFMNYVT